MGHLVPIFLPRYMFGKGSIILYNKHAIPDFALIQGFKKSNFSLPEEIVVNSKAHKA